jgi:hypothetical protein
MKLSITLEIIVKDSRIEKVEKSTNHSNLHHLSEVKKSVMNRLRNGAQKK